MSWTLSLSWKVFCTAPAIQFRPAAASPPRWPGAGVDQIHIRPLLRRNWAAGTALEIARPVCRMRLADDEQGAIDKNFARMQNIDVQFIEAVEGSS
jgi:hypothetical protein